MGIQEIRSVLMWCTIINSGMLLLWFVLVVVAGDWIYRSHSKWFSMSREAFDTAHYCGIGLFKMVVFIFNVIPLIALWIVT